MQTSSSIVKISASLVKAQKEIGGAKKGSTNPFFHSKYADLGSVMEACKDALNNNGIVVLQPVGRDEGLTGEQYVETILLHESGEFISDKMRLVMKEDNNPQAQGSAISYARRYSLQSMVFIPAEDDDGEKAKPAVIVLETKKAVDPDWIANGNTPTSQQAASLAQVTLVNDLAVKKGLPKEEIKNLVDKAQHMSKTGASAMIEQLKSNYR